MMQPPLSPDGRFWWDGRQWQPVPPQAQLAAPPPVAPQPWPVPPGMQAPQVYQAAAAASQPMGRWARGWRIGTLSWAVLRADRQLLILPVLALVAMLAMLAAFAIPAVALEVWQPRNRAVEYLLGFLLYVVTSFVSYYFNAAMIGAAMLKLNGQAATWRDGLRLASSRVDKIFQWAIVSATVGIIIRFIEQRLGIAGQIFGFLAGLVWAVATSFIVPVLIYENYGMADSFRRSAQLIRQRWGENLGAGVSASLPLLAWMLAGIAVSIVLLVVAWPLGILAMAITIFGTMVVGSALSAVYKAALYQFAVTGQVGMGGFTTDDFAAAFRPRRRRW